MSFADKELKNRKPKEEAQMPARPVRKTSEASQPVATAKPAEPKEVTQSATILSQELPEEVSKHLCSLRDELAEIKAKSTKAAAECDVLIKAISKLVEDANSKPVEAPGTLEALKYVFVFKNEETNEIEGAPNSDIAYKYNDSVSRYKMRYD